MNLISFSVFRLLCVKVLFSKGKMKNNEKNKSICFFIRFKPCLVNFFLNDRPTIFFVIFFFFKKLFFPSPTFNFLFLSILSLVCTLFYPPPRFLKKIFMEISSCSVHRLRFCNFSFAFFIRKIHHNFISFFLFTIIIIIVENGKSFNYLLELMRKISNEKIIVNTKSQ